MFAGLLSLLGFKRQETALIVDYGEKPCLPRDARRVIRHKPAGTGIMTITAGDFELKEFQRGTTYAEYYRAHASEPLCDAVILDALWREILKNQSKADNVLTKYFGSFSGQIFFLGTAFESEDGRECVSYLNLNTYQPHLRYMCPTHHVINHSVMCCVAFLRKKPDAANLIAKYRTIEDEVLETHEDGSKTHRVIECNGILHQRCVDKISYDKDGEITFVDQLSREELGPCTCEKKASQSTEQSN